MSTKHVATLCRKLGFNKGAPRLWIEGIFPSRAGFKPGTRYSVSSPDGEKRVVLKIDDKGVRLVSSKTKADRELPVIDLNSRELLERFDGMDMVRVVMREGEIHILASAVEIKKAERKKRLDESLAKGTIAVGAVSHGVGVIDHAMHTGLAREGIRSRLGWICEIEDVYAEQAAYANEVWDDSTQALVMPLQTLAFADDYTLSQIPKTDMVIAGLPCTAASLSGRAKKGLAMPEHDKVAGHLVAPFIALLARINPAIVVLENVPVYFNTASASILRTSLEELGFVLHETVFDGQQYAIETRQRQVLVAITEGVDFDFESLVAPPRAEQPLGTILEDVALDDPMWKEVPYLKAKQERDQAAGKGFKMQLVDVDTIHVGTQGRGYAKARSTEARLVHPTDPEKSRLFTPLEHARIKGIPEHLIKDVESNTRAHEMLGQSAVWGCFVHLGSHLGQALANYSQRPVLEPADAEAPLPLFNAA
jgi:DNA (cytosine-5)-methyltransferase 1